MNQARIELLQQMPVFGAVGSATLEFLLAEAPVVELPTGQFFFREGDPPRGMFVLESGRASISKSWEGRELLLLQLNEGDCFGEMALLDLFPRSASVRADSDCRAIEITAANLYRLFERDPEQFALIQMNIAREMSRRLRATDEKLFRARMGDVPAAPERLHDPGAAPPPTGTQPD